MNEQASHIGEAVDAPEQLYPILFDHMEYERGQGRAVIIAAIGLNDDKVTDDIRIAADATTIAIANPQHRIKCLIATGKPGREAITKNVVLALAAFAKKHKCKRIVLGIATASDKKRDSSGVTTGWERTLPKPPFIFDHAYGLCIRIREVLGAMYDVFVDDWLFVGEDEKYVCSHSPVDYQNSKSFESRKKSSMVDAFLDSLNKKENKE